jgi:hypothetical protein
MDLFAIDDSGQSRPTRDGMGPLLAVGGLHVPGELVRDLELRLDALCTATGFPVGEEFKWSPHKRAWEYDSLKFEARDEFNLAALELARSHLGGLNESPQHKPPLDVLARDRLAFLSLSCWSRRT